MDVAVTSMSEVVAKLTDPSGLWPLSELFKDRKKPPSSKGIYGWWFDSVPAIVPVEKAVSVNGRRLLYIGIAPDYPSSRSNVRKRIRFHRRDNSSSSTLRRSLGCLLAEKLGLRFRCINGRWMYGDDEPKLSSWMAEHAAVSWAEHDHPWDIEPLLCQQLFLPLNLEHNEHCPFYPVLWQRRQAAKG